MEVLHGALGTSANSECVPERAFFYQRGESFYETIEPEQMEYFCETQPFPKTKLRDLKRWHISLISPTDFPDLSHKSPSSLPHISSQISSYVSPHPPLISPHPPTHPLACTMCEQRPSQCAHWPPASPNLPSPFQACAGEAQRVEGAVWQGGKRVSASSCRRAA